MTPARHPLALLALALSSAARRLRAEAASARSTPPRPQDLTVDQIITKFGEREAEFAQPATTTPSASPSKSTPSTTTPARSTANTSRSPTSSSPDGKREEHVVFAPQNTLDSACHDDPRRLRRDRAPPSLHPHHRRPAQVRRQLPRPPEGRRPRHLRLRGRPEEHREEQALLPGQGLGRPAGLRRSSSSTARPFPRTRAPATKTCSRPSPPTTSRSTARYWFPTYTKAEGILHFAAQNGLSARTSTCAQSCATPTTSSSAPPAASSTTARTSPTRKIRDAQQPDQPPRRQSERAFYRGAVSVAVRST